MAETESHQGSGVPQSFWSGTISFGLVSIPVELFTATRSDRASLRLLDQDGTPLARRYYCSIDERPLDRDDIVRGYEVEDGEHVLITDQELEQLEPAKSREIDLRQFVPLDEIDPLYFERAYLLTPGGDTNKAYRLLAKILEHTGRAGIATFVMRGKEYLVAILAEQGILRAETLRFQDELRSPEEIGLPEPEAPPRTEIRRWHEAITATSADSLDLGELEDETTRRLLDLVESKRRKRKDVVRAPDAEEGEEGAEVVDLMEVLRKSLRGEQGDRSRRRRPPPAAPGPDRKKRAKGSVRPSGSW